MPTFNVSKAHKCLKTSYFNCVWSLLTHIHRNKMHICILSIWDLKWGMDQACWIESNYYYGVQLNKLNLNPWHMDATSQKNVPRSHWKTSSFHASIVAEFLLHCDCPFKRHYLIEIILYSQITFDQFLSHHSVSFSLEPLYPSP